MIDLNKKLDPTEIINNLMGESKEQTAERRANNEKRRELDAEYPQYQGCKKKQDDDWDMRDEDY